MRCYFKKGTKGDYYEGLQIISAIKSLHIYIFEEYLTSLSEM